MPKILNSFVMMLVTAGILFACSSDKEVVEEESAADMLAFSIGDDEFELPIELCQISVIFVMVKGWRDASSASMSYDGQSTNVSFQVGYESDGIRFRDQWDSQEGTEHSTDGFSVTASGTVQHVSRHKLEDPDAEKWVRLEGPGPLGEQPFELSATCTET